MNDVSKDVVVVKFRKPKALCVFFGVPVKKILQTKNICFVKGEDGVCLSAGQASQPFPSGSARVPAEHGKVQCGVNTLSSLFHVS